MGAGEFREFLRRERLDDAAVQTWVAAGWLAPRPPGDLSGFSEVDLARARLIFDLQRMGVNDDGIPIILDLIDQLHGVRRRLGDVLAAFSAQSQLRPDQGKPWSHS
jgi:chaperone modulatory protein CbpM